MLFDSRGNQVPIGQELGRGGEGTVYETPGRAGMVAKVYLAPPDAKKQEKLSFMARTADASLLKYAAWPQDTLHKVRGGPAVGFLMGKVSGKDPIHMIYGPKHRRQKLPNIGWDFLLFVARNTAAAFETLHAHGHVLCDVNQGNVMVGGDSQVILIDSDSYQIRAQDTVHFCEVGVAHFTPPELQGISSFRNVTRSSNHDNFGLALLIFHLLFGGRHPYSGVPLRKGVGDSLESDIKSLHYAYARDSQSRGVASPPGSIALSIVPDAMESMFHQAFTEGGVKGGRPTSAQWVQALDVQRGQLKKCAVSRTHVFPSHLSTCPWCALEQKGIVYFIDLGVTFTQAASGFVMAQVWARIMAVAPPAAPAIPDPSSYSPAGKPVTGVAAKKGNTLGVDLTIGACVLLFFIFPAAWFVWGGVVWLAVANRTPSEPPERIAERAARRLVVEQAQRAYDDLITRFKREAGPEGFLAKRKALEKLKTEYEQQSQAEATELEQLKTTAHERQKQKFLDGFFIDAADIPGVGPGRKTALRSFGIETAADVSRNAVMQVKGFGPNLTRAMTDWRATCERRFTFNPSAAVTEADRNAVRAKYVARWRSIESLLIAAPAELSGFTQTALARANHLKAQAENAASALAKAKADLAMLA